MIVESYVSKLNSRFPELRSLFENDSCEFVRRCTPVSVPEGTRVFGVGSRCESFLLLISGQVKVFTLSEGRELVLYRVRPGESCVMTTSCLLGATDYQAYGVAESDLFGVAIPDRLFRELLAESSGFREFVFSTFSVRLSDLFGLVHEVAFYNLDRRVAKFLLKASSEQVTHQQIADELGTVREIVSRRLKSMEKNGMLALSRNRIQVIDPTKLRGLVSAHSQ